MNEGGLYEQGICLKGDSMRGAWREGSLLGTPKDMLKRYFKRDVQMPCKRVSLSTGAPLGKVGVIRLPGLFER